MGAYHPLHCVWLGLSFIRTCLGLKYKWEHVNNKVIRVNEGENLHIDCIKTNNGKSLTKPQGICCGNNYSRFEQRFKGNNLLEEVTVLFFKMRTISDANIASGFSNKCNINLIVFSEFSEFRESEKSLRHLCFLHKRQLVKYRNPFNYYFFVIKLRNFSQNVSARNYHLYKLRFINFFSRNTLCQTTWVVNLTL